MEEEGRRRPLMVLRVSGLLLRLRSSPLRVWVPLPPVVVLRVPLPGLLVSLLRLLLPRCRCRVSMVGRPSRGARGRFSRRSYLVVLRGRGIKIRRGRSKVPQVRVLLVRVLQVGVLPVRVLPVWGLRISSRNLFLPPPPWRWLFRSSPGWRRCFPWRLLLRFRCLRRSRSTAGNANRSHMR